VSFSAEHQYLDDGAAPGNNTASDSSTITVTVTDDDASDLITFAFSGTVNDVDFDTGTPAEFAVGDAFSGSYTFDSTDADSNVSPNNGYYLSSIATLSFSAGTYSGSFANGNILVRDDVPVQDLYRVETQSTALPGPSVLGLPLDSFTLEINDFTGTVFSSDVLLLVPPDLTDFQSTTLELLFFDPFGGDFGQVRATLDSLTLASPANAGVGAATTQVTVNNIAPAFDAGGAGPDEALNPPVAGAFSRTGITFNDPGTLDVHTVEVDWDGNGSYDQTINVPLGDRDFDLSHTFLTEGSFTVAVRLTDDDLGGVIDSFVVEVILNQAPEADAGGPYVVDEGESLILNGSGSTDPDSTNPPDNNNDIVTYEWDLDYNGFTFDVDFSTTSPVDTAAAFPDNFAVRDIALRVTDSHGETDIATTTLTVDNVAPTGTFNAPTSVNEGDAIELSITDPFDPSDTDTTVGFEYAFDFGSGFGAFGTSSTASFTAADDAVLTVKGKIRDKDGAETEYTASVTVNNVNPTLTVVSDQSVDEGSLLSLPDLGVITDPGFDNPTNPNGASEETFTFSIDWGDSTAADSGSATIDDVGGVGDLTDASFDGSHTYVDDGVYTVTVRVADDDMTGNFVSGTLGTDFVQQTFEVTVSNVTPSDLTLSLSASSINENDSTELSGSFVDPGTLDAHTVTIDWGDGPAC
jgi:hypothetical protein